MNYNPRRLFVASCLALITSAFSFQMRQDSGDDFRSVFNLTQEMVGSIMGGQFLGMASSMLIFAFICDSLGMGRVLFLAWICHACGISGTIFAGELTNQSFATTIANGLAGASDWMTQTFHWSLLPEVPANNTSFWVLFLAAFLTGCGNGLVEIAINPLAATIYPENKTHKLNVLHAWWPGGLIIAGLLAQFFVNPLYGRAAEFFGYKIDPATLGIADFVKNKAQIWQFKYGLVAVPLLLYGLFAVGQRFPATERVQANVSTGTMILQIFRPLFIIWAICMLLTASTELGTNTFMESILRRTTRSAEFPDGISGTVIFVYTLFFMFVLRFFAGPLAHRFSPVGLLCICSILTVIGLLGLSQANNPVMAFGAATVFGIGIAYYWPTMLGVTAERFPKGGALVLGLMGCVGNLAISQATTQIGKVYDSGSVSKLPADYQAMKISTPSGESVPLVTKGTDVPKVYPQVEEFLFPAGGKKLEPRAVNALKELYADEKKKNSEAKKPEELQVVEDAEAGGASFALTRIAVMPAALFIIFGLIGLVDKMRGGYKQVHLDTSRNPVPQWPRDLRR
jgi:fucose permease